MAEKDERYYHAYLSHNQISRRGLFRGMFGGAHKSVSSEYKRQAPRPPFAAPEHLFLHFCDGCGQCAAVCPYGLIQIQHGKAELTIDYSACDFCGECVSQCPTNALNPAFKADTGLRPQFGNSCVQRHHQTYNSCRQACPQQAISADLQLDFEKCNGCGECKIACYVQAIKLG